MFCVAVLQTSCFTTPTSHEIRGVPHTNEPNSVADSRFECFLYGRVDYRFHFMGARRRKLGQFCFPLYSSVYPPSFDMQSMVIESPHDNSMRFEYNYAFPLIVYVYIT